MYVNKDMRKWRDVYDENASFQSRYSCIRTCTCFSVCVCDMYTHLSFEGETESQQEIEFTWGSWNEENFIERLCEVWYINK